MEGKVSKPLLTRLDKDSLRHKWGLHLAARGDSPSPMMAVRGFATACHADPAHTFYF